MTIVVLEDPTFRSLSPEIQRPLDHFGHPDGGGTERTQARRAYLIHEKDPSHKVKLISNVNQYLP